MPHNLIDEMPPIEKYAVGECEMLHRENGAYMHVNKIRALIDWLTDDDDREVIMTKLAQLRGLI